MKVVQFLYPGLGGHGSVAFSLVEGDLEHRWSNAFGFVGIETLLPDYRRRCEEKGISFAEFRALERRPWNTWPRIYRWLKRTTPDVIICHGGSALIPSYLYAAGRGLRVIFVVHTPMGVWRWSEIIYSWLGMLMADSVVMLTVQLAEKVRAKLGRAYRPEKVSIIANGINTDRFCPSKPKGTQKHRTIRIGMAGRLTPIKRHDQLIRTLKVLQNLDPEREWMLTFAGDGEERLRLEDHARQVVPHAVEFTGTLDEASLRQWYRNLDVYTHASDGETQSTAILQAMACQLPIVASNAPGIPEMIREDAGILVENDNPRAWAEQIIQLVSSTKRMAALGQAARAVCVRDYGHVRMHRAYDDLIRDFSSE